MAELLTPQWNWGVGKGTYRSSITRVVVGLPLALIAERRARPWTRAGMWQR